MGANSIHDSGSSLLSLLLSHWEDFWIIICLLLINATVAFFQEHKADNAINLLKRKLPLRVRVIRDRTWIEIPARELVPGDVVRIRLGDIIPADAVLMVNISLLTSPPLLESQCQRKNM